MGRNATQSEVSRSYMADEAREFYLRMRTQNERRDCVSGDGNGEYDGRLIPSRKASTSLVFHPTQLHQ